ncbi:MAG: hypothetical protein IJP27_01930 [Clostridia bacterium]|nr:hypothetical protein [Clostridia bacterium]
MKRRDGVRVRHSDPMYMVAAHVMDKRMDSMNMITIDIPIDPVAEYVHRKRDEGGMKISRLAVLLAAYIRVIDEFPQFNHFIVNCNRYARNEIAVGMVVLKGGSLTEGGTISKVYFQPTDDVFKVQERLDEYIARNREIKPENGTEKMISFLLSVPGLLRVGVKLFRWMDKHGLLPKAVIDMSPFHISLLITDLASIRLDPIYHHVYEFGTTSIAMAMGVNREVPKRKGEEIIHEKCMPLGIVMDERIAGGSYFALGFRRLKHYLKHPELLEQPPEVIHDEIKKLFKLGEESNGRNG